MRFYTHRHKYYCGIDLYTSVMFVCITDAAGTILVHKNLRANPESFVRIIEPYQEDLAVAVECMFVWYWIADLCAQLGVTFVLGHAFYMKAIHGGKVKNDRIDSEKIAQLLRSGTLPEAYAYPGGMRSTRATCFAGACIWYTGMRSCRRTSRTPATSTTCLRSRSGSIAPETERGSLIDSMIRW
jgi:hypothetical protein